MWVADMDFRCPQPVIDALHQRVEHGVFGYGYPAFFENDRGPVTLLDLWRERMQSRYGWQLAREDIVVVDHLITAMHAVSHIVGQPGDAVLIPTPNYWPLVDAPPHHERQLLQVPMAISRQGQTMRFELDFDALEAAITPQTRLLMYCNPHNPVGRVYTRQELERLADIALRHDLIICSDEIHLDLMMDGNQHIPMASLSPEVAQRCVTLTGVTKTFNIPGLRLGLVIAQNPALMSELKAYYSSIGGLGSNVMGFAAYEAALRHGQPWLDGLLAYLQANRDFAIQYIAEHMPGLRVTVPEATFLLLLDCQDVIEGDPFEFFLDKAQVALSGGFGPQGFGHIVRLNYGCPRSLLRLALSRMATALA
jgi:cystathionine beta-lyase